MRKTLGLCLLVLLLSGTASAGIMGNDDAAQSEPQPTAAQEQTSGETANGEIPNDATASLTQTILELLASVLP